jgi:phosphoglycerol transferase MdoB-like AlkP superfamily enzyme
VPRRPTLLRGQLGLPFLFLALFVAIATALRIVLLLDVAGSVSWTPRLLAYVFGTGFVFDLAVGLYASLPFALALLALPERALRSLPFRILVLALFGAASFVFLFSAVAEWFFWREFGARFNFIAVDYLAYTREVLGNIWESYPIPALLAVLATAASIVLWALSSRVSACLAASGAWGFRCRQAGLWLAASSLCLGLLDASWAERSREPTANELARNGLYSLFAAFRSNELDYATNYVTESDDAASGRLGDLLGREPGVEDLATATYDMTRRIVHRGPELRPNVILVVVESLSAHYLGTFGDENELTPNLDALARQSLVFTNLYATGTRTVRGLEAITLSVPPTPGASIVKRPRNEGMFSLGFVFREKGYRTQFLYGGYGYFDDMNHFFSTNGFEVVDRSDLSNEEISFSNSWGVSDEDLFALSLREADRDHAAGAPFLQLVMTTSNHRPFTYPPGRVAIPSGTGRHGGVQYTDHAIGRFLAEASRRPWFEDTLLVVVADHCASSTGRIELPLPKYHIPLLVYWPKHLRPARVDTLASQMDLAPTLLGLLRWTYTSRFLGRDILRTPAADERAFVATYEKLGYLDHGVLTVLSPKRQVDSLLIDATTRKAISRASGADTARLANAIAYYQSASSAWQRDLGRWDGVPAASPQGPLP